MSYSTTAPKVKRVTADEKYWTMRALAAEQALREASFGKWLLHRLLPKVPVSAFSLGKEKP